jgi:ferredoxin-type protein NapF
MATGTDLTRRSLLRGQSRASAPQPTPPWALDYDAFIERCTRCGDCLPVCPENIIKKGEGGFPTVDFSNRACTFCGACVDRCQSGALSRAVDPPWQLKAQIDERCLTHQGVYCQSCRDGCDTRAIEFRLRAGEPVPKPHIDVSRCTGCGECVAVCPTNAVSVTRSGER